jgi:tripartite-type tricarboxylate transporter receptor subunit TctC
VIARINRDINAALSTADVKDKLAALGIEARGGTPEEFSAYLKSELPKWAKVVRASGAKPE